VARFRDETESYAELADEDMSAGALSARSQDAAWLEPVSWAAFGLAASGSRSARCRRVLASRRYRGPRGRAAFRTQLERHLCHVVPLDQNGAVRLLEIADHRGSNRCANHNLVGVVPRRRTHLLAGRPSPRAG